MGTPLLLDEMPSGTIAQRLRSRGHDVVAVVEDRTLVGLPDEDILGRATAAGRAVVTVNVKDFVAQRCKAQGVSHRGIVLVSSRTFRQDRTFKRAIIRALDRTLRDDSVQPDTVVFLRR